MTRDRQLDALGRRQFAAFYEARDEAFKRAAGVQAFNWLYGHPNVDDFGKGHPHLHRRPRPDALPLPDLDHGTLFGHRHRLVLAVAWPYADPAAVRAQLEPLADQFAYAVVDGDHPAARVYPTHPMAWVAVHRTLPNAEDIVEIFTEAKWAEPYAEEITELRRREVELRESAR